ncbi:MULTISPECIES: sulfotransferase family 2 domain-containing protein [Pseudovibrio]|uniref:sulfotransferase family 2 domain-containing protein n=1 Tax=Stappiaceae TaxID=2821832 RepID=UPI0023664F12|nr:MULTISPECIES: sulfotransferase family 2 domain-containing protein [Pseudovibrio]MDD7908856.1 sulfotransferase family 2 domain-containing protein [Pseudovibrio exalbescens]MDX5593826.1 sulfotransferase family 2 domain-containing protein [Pseudovibrio sp. SPO723]
MLRALYSLYDRSRRPLRDRVFFILPNLKMAYGRIPGASGCAGDPILRRLNSIEFALEHGSPDFKPDPEFPYEALECVKARDLLRTPNRLMTIAVLKHPLHRLMSCYRQHFGAEGIPSPRLEHYGLDQSTSFGGFVRRICRVPDYRADNYFRSQIDILSHRGQFVPDFVLTTDHMEEGLQGLRAIISRRTGVDMGSFERSELENYFSISFPSHSNAEEVEFHLATRYKSDLEMFTRHAAGSA